jgi:hypothetical protein
LKRIGDNNPDYECFLYRDFAPYSLQFAFHKKEGPSKTLLHGGLVFDGDPDESLSVQLVPSKGFAIHT